MRKVSAAEWIFFLSLFFVSSNSYIPKDQFYQAKPIFSIRKQSNTSNCTRKTQAHFYQIITKISFVQKIGLRHFYAKTN
jgi:hypothetical protein